MFRLQRSIASTPRVPSALAFRAMLRFALACLALAALPAVAPQAAPSGQEFASAFAETSEGVTIHYLHGGQKSVRPVVVFVPGWTWPASIWTDQMKALADSRRVVAIDSRSQGESSQAPSGNTPEGRADDLHVLLPQFSDSPVVLVGWSQGVQDIAAYIERHGTGRIAGLVLVDSALAAGPASFIVDPEATKLLLHRISLYAHYPSEYLAGMIDASLAQPMSADRKSSLVRASAKTPTNTGIAMLVSDLLTTDRRGVVDKIDRPTLIVAAENSGEIEALRQMARDIPGAQLSVISGAGHAVFVDQPVHFSEALARFLDDLPGTKPQ
jgi:pimeloyl-ACP methyl ester carboxylesterase